MSSFASSPSSSPAGSSSSCRRKGEEDPSNNTIDGIKNQVRDELRIQKIKLWCPPYVQNENTDVVVVSELENLAKSWKENHPVFKSNKDENVTVAAILQALQDWQSHALEKLQAKKNQKQQKKPENAIGKASSLSSPSVVPTVSRVNVEIKILLGGLSSSSSAAATAAAAAGATAGRQSSVDVVIDPSSFLKAALAPPTANTSNRNNISENVEANQDSNNNIVLSLKGVSVFETTDVRLCEFLQKLVVRASSNNKKDDTDDNNHTATENTINLRLVHRGKNISSSTNNNEAGTPLAHIFQSSLMSSGEKDAPVPVLSLLCLVSVVDKAEQERANLQSRIDSIRNAVQCQIRNTTKFEITNQHGQIVPMTKQDRLSFVTALAFHRLGLAASNHQESLVLLLEADSEWKNLGQEWKDRVDNYGLLQLDMAWIYLQLGSLSNLPDCLQRLQESERVLMKQVHTNFVPLAIAQAEMGNASAVPPLAAVFAKLFLLQGIAYLYDAGNADAAGSREEKTKKGQERLDQAYVLLQCLRSTAPEESVQQLLEVMGATTSATTSTTATYPAYYDHQSSSRYTESDAIAALRKSQGDLEAAVLLLSEQETKRRQHQQDREIQHGLGLCQNETDPVDLNNLKTLEPLLKGNGNSNSGSSQPLLDTANADLAVGLLRLADNDLTRALEIYAQQEYNPHKVYELVDALDERLVSRGLLGRTALGEKRKKRKLYAATTTTTESSSSPDAVMVDEMSLVTLVSMGVEDSKAKTALQKTGNDIEKAMVWLSTFGDFSSNDEEQKQGSGDVGNCNVDGTATETNMVDSGEEKKAEEEEDKDTEGGGANDDDDDDKDHDHHHGSSMDWEAQELLHRELDDILEDRDLEKEYLGKTLDEEWMLVLKYRKSNSG